MDATVTTQRSGTSELTIEAEMKSVINKELTDMVESGSKDGYEFAASVSVEDPKPGTFTFQCHFINKRVSQHYKSFTLSMLDKN